MKRVHMGCGLTHLEGWINCDGSPSVRMARWPRPILSLLQASGLVGSDVENFWHFLSTFPVLYVNSHRPWPFATNSIDIIYSSHMIDCFGMKDKIHFFQESFRVLKPSGVIRLAGLDLAREVENYLQSNDSSNLLHHLSYPNPNDESLLTRLKNAIRPKKLYVAQLDFTAYKRLLSEVGFADVIHLPPGETTIKNLEPVNLWQRQGESLYVEAYKPGDSIPRVH